MKTLLSILLFAIPPSVIAQVFTLNDMMKLVPDKISGYRQVDGSKSNELKIGNISYSICQKDFSSGSKHITILLFDFKNAPIMYNQVTREWKKYQTIESDTLTHRSITEANYFGWEYYHPANRSSKISLGISERFYLAIDGKNIPLESLKEVVKLFALESYPK